MVRRDNLVAVVRTAAFLTFSYSVFYMATHVTTPPVAQKLPYGKLKYLTFWDLLLQFGFFTLVTVASLFKIKSKSFHKTLDYLFYSLAFPVALIVSVTFWSIYMVDRELIFPRILEPYYPPWLNHATHTMVTVFVVAELILAKHKPPSVIAGVTTLFVFNLTYTLWVLFIAHQHKFWVYPFLELLTWPQRFMFFGMATAANVAFYFAGVVAYDVFNPVKHPSKKHKK